MKFKNIMILLAVTVLLSTISYAKDDNNLGKMTGIGPKLDDDDDDSDKPVREDMREKDKSMSDEEDEYDDDMRGIDDDENETDDDDENDSDDDALELDDENETDHRRLEEKKGQSKNKTRYREGENETDDNEGDESMGQIISSMNQARREQFRLMKEEMRQIGYHGPVDDFAVAFNRQLNQLRLQVRERINSSEDSNLTASVMREVARRELARIREEKLAGLNVSDNDTLEALQNISDSEENFTDEIHSMNHRFRFMVNEVAWNGTVEEKQQLRERIRNYAQERKTTIRLLRDALKFRYETARDLLKENRTLDEILENLSESD
ncbi:MAG: hypothetical protein V1921_05485 [Candidatus Altiarchaeota archaeon]